MDDFESWLEYEFPCHSAYDFDTLGAYEHWKRNMRLAFEAGLRAGKADVKDEPVRWWAK